MKENMEKKDEFEDDAVKIWKRIHEERAMTSDVAMIKAALRQAHARGKKEAYEDAAKYHGDIANGRFCGPEYRRVHERDRELFTAKAAAITEGK